MKKTFISFTSSFSSEKTKNNLNKLGCVPKKSLILTFPTEEQVPDDFLYAFVKGYIDGDGYIQFDNEKSRYRIIICGTKDFLEGLQLRLKIENFTKVKATSGKIFKLIFSGKQNIYLFLEKLYSTKCYSLKRKREIFIQAKLGFQRENAVRKN